VLVLGLLDVDRAVTLERQRGTGLTLHGHHISGDRDGYVLGDLERLIPDTRHDSPDLAEDFAADALGAGIFVGHHAERRGEDRDAEAVADARHLLGRNIRALAGTRDPAHAGDRAARAQAAAVVAQRELPH